MIPLVYEPIYTQSPLIVLLASCVPIAYAERRFADQPSSPV